MADGIVCWTADGKYSVIIDSATLQAAADGFKGTLSNKIEMENAIHAAFVPAEAFGTVPGGKEAAGRLSDAVQSHIDAIEHMGVSLADFAARMKAAVQQAEQARQDTTAAAERAGYHHDY
jgi:hypothetical protein